MGDMGGNENGNANANGKGKEPMEPPNNFRIPPPSPQPPRQCPRCFSTNTKFCYYNNRSVSQPRYHCKSCKRYWTHGGALRNIPIGGSCHKGSKKMVKGESSSGSLSSASCFHVGESSRVREPPRPTTPSPLPAHTRGLANNGLSFSNSFSLQGELFSSVARLQNSLSQRFNQVPLNGGAHATNFSLSQGLFGSPNQNGPPQIQHPINHSNNGQQQAMAQPSMPLGSLAGGRINHLSGSNINATLPGSNHVPGSASAMNQWYEEFYVDDVEDLFSGSSPPPPPPPPPPF